MIYFTFFVISQKAHCWCLFAWGGLSAHSCVPGSNKGQSAIAPSTRAEGKTEANATALPEKKEPWNGRKTLGYDAGSFLGPGSKVRADHDTGHALAPFPWGCDPGDPTNHMMQVHSTQPGLAQFRIAVLCPNYSMT